MALNRIKEGNMYNFVQFSWNPIRGICLHRCRYCYAKKAQGLAGVVHIEEKCFKDRLGEHRSIFVGSSTDMWGNWIADADIRRVLDHCRKFENSYLFQTKNPGKWAHFDRTNFPGDSTLAVTIESNREYPDISNAPGIKERICSLIEYRSRGNLAFPLMVTIEPILDFDVNELVEMLKLVMPKQVNIGADSKGHRLPEPSSDKVIELIDQLSEFTTIYMKKNLNRIKKQMSSYMNN